ncbi:MAG: hypothetical protein LUG18_14590 [Candidatus Azobacteroides sp.]|nr:hypothetical protein [Candidatus Azobacteroides sp.]
MSPDNPLYGIEKEGMEGLLTYYDNKNQKIRKKIKAEKSSYLTLFEEVYQSIRNNKPYPVTREQIIAQLNILEQ